MQLKGTVTVISSDLLYKDVNARFKTVRIPESDQNYGRCHRFFDRKVHNSVVSSLILKQEIRQSLSQRIHE